MSLEEFALIAEIVGGIAVVVTVIYFAIEIRRNTEAVKSATHQQQVDTTANLNSNVSNDPQLAALIASAAENYGTLKVSEQLQLQFFYTNYFNMWHYQYLNREKGTFDREAFGVWDNGMGILLNSHVGMRETWSVICGNYGESFRSHVNTLIAKLGDVESADGKLIDRGLGQ